MRKILVLSLGGAVATVFGIVLVTQVAWSNPIQDPEASSGLDELPDRFDADNWPAAVSANYGFEWNDATYTELNGFTEQENVTSILRPYWKDESPEYRCFVTRTVRLETTTGTELTVRITRCPNYDAAKNQMALSFQQSSIGTFDEYHGATFELNVGDISILRDVPNIDGSYEPDETFEGVDSNDLVFVRGNLIVDVSFEPSQPQGLGFTAAELCQSIDAEILAQYNAVSGNYEVPNVGVSITSSVGDLTNLPSPTDDTVVSPVAVFKSHPSSAAVQTRAFVANRSELGELDENGIWTPDPTGAFRWIVVHGHEEVFLDDVEDPTNLTMSTFNDPGDWKLLVFAWGPNLVPVYDTADYTIIK